MGKNDQGKWSAISEIVMYVCVCITLSVWGYSCNARKSDCGATVQRFGLEVR